MLLVPYALLALKFTEGRGEVSEAVLRGERRATDGVAGMSCSEIEGEAADLRLRVERLVVDMMDGCRWIFLTEYNSYQLTWWNAMSTLVEGLSFYVSIINIFAK